MTLRLEHANLFVRDIDATIRFLQTAFPEFRMRFDGMDPRGFRWVHIGTDDTYIALTQSMIEPEPRSCRLTGRWARNPLAAPPRRALPGGLIA